MQNQFRQSIYFQSIFNLFLIYWIIFFQFSFLYLQYFYQKMVEFTFKGLFLTTSKGIPDLTNLPPSTTMARPYYICSILLQALILLLFLLYFALSIFRVFKKIKNSKFEDVPDADALQQKTQKQAKQNAQKNDGKQNQNQKQDKLIYRFDEQQEQQQEEKNQQKGNEDNKVEKSEHLKQEKQEPVKEESYDDYHDQNEQSYIQFDDKMLFLQPFLISFIVSNNMFTADASTLILFILTVASYFVFNVKKKLSNLKYIEGIFVILATLGLLSFFYADHDLST